MVPSARVRSFVRSQPAPIIGARVPHVVRVVPDRALAWRPRERIGDPEPVPAVATVGLRHNAVCIGAVVLHGAVDSFERFTRKRRGENFVASFFVRRFGRHLDVLFLSCSTFSNERTISDAPSRRCVDRERRCTIADLRGAGAVAAALGGGCGRAGAGASRRGHRDAIIVAAGCQVHGPLPTEVGRSSVARLRRGRTWRPLNRSDGIDRRGVSDRPRS